MKITLHLNVFLLLMLLVLTACQNHPPGQSEETAYMLDPTRANPPYPAIAIPEDADTTAPRWKGIDLSPAPPVIPISPAEELRSFVLQPGYQMEAVLTEPQIMEPAAIQFDGNGRMYVLELRTYMQDIDATGELSPVSRISRWEDRDNDGQYETGTVFLDSLIFPRFVVPFGPNTILSMESNQDRVYKYTDTDGDGKADQKEFFTEGMGRSGNVEHQTSFLTWTLDNWMYSTYNPKRVRWTPEGVIQEPSGTPWGQWGVTQDNYGLVWMQDGAGGVPQNFQFPIVYGNYQVEGQYESGFRIPYSLVRLEDYEPGMRGVKPDGSLSTVTGAAGNDVFRGHRLPKELRGEYFYGEPVARIVRRVTSTKREGLTYLSNPYQGSEAEFIQSTDPLFRPVDIATAPDGTMYIVDMYRGIIQQGTWTPEGSYLRTKIQQYLMDDVVSNGRIWRLTNKSMERDKTQPRMFEETASELVDHLSHPNGWWRDKAQQLLILRQDRSVIPDLIDIMNHSDEELARIHALWTLEGLRGLTADHIRTLLKDPSAQIRYQALRAGESLYKYGYTALGDSYKVLTGDPEIEVVIQAMQSMYLLKVEGTDKTIRELLKSDSRQGIQVVGKQILEYLDEEQQQKNNQYSTEELTLFNAGKKTFDTFCATCHGKSGMGSPVGSDGQGLMAPAFAGSTRINGHPEYAVKTLLHGLTGSIEGRDYGSLMIAMDMNDDEYIASVVSYIRNAFGNESEFVYPDYVARIREATQSRQKPYLYADLIREVPQPQLPGDGWNVTASSTALRGVGSTRDPGYAFSYKGWRSEEKQSPETWYEIRFPQPVILAEIRYESGKEEFPAELSVMADMGGENWEELASVNGHPGLQVVPVNPADKVHAIRMQCTEDSENFWGMKNLTIYARAQSPVQ